MSLIHEALKKAEKGRTPLEGEVFVDHEGGQRPPSNLRLYILVGLTISGLILVVALQFFGKGLMRPQPAQTSTGISTPLGLAGVTGVEALQMEIDANVRAGRWSDADKALEKWVLLEPRNAEAYNNLGLAKKKLGSKEAAYEQYQKALAIRPDYPEALNNLGVLFLSEGKLSEGKGYFQRAIQFKPDFAEPYFHLALIAESEGKDLEATAQFQKYLQLARDLDASFLLQIQNRIDALKSSG